MVIRKAIENWLRYFRHIESINIFAASIFLILAALAVFLFFPLFYVEPPRKIIPLQGEWKISLEDSKDYSQVEYNDESWDTIRLPGEIVPYSIEKQNSTKGICWLRKTVFIEDSDQTYGLILGRIANADETFVNGQKIGGLGQFPPHELSLWNHPRNYSIPDACLKKGDKNVIAVRLSFNVIGEIIGKLMVTDNDYMKKYAVLSRFIHVSSCYITISMGFVLFFTFLLAHLKHLKFDGTYLYFLQLFVGLPIILELCMTWKIYPNPIFRVKILGLAWVGLNVVHPMFLHRLYKLNRIWPERILWAHLFICTIGAVFFTSEHNLRFLATLLIVSTWCIGFYNISCHVEALIKNRKYSKIFSFFGIIAILTAMNDGLIFFDKFVDFNLSFFGFTPNIMLLQFGTIFLYLGTFLVLESEYRDMVEEIDDLNQNLETFIIENSLLNEKLENSSSTPKKPAKLSPRTEEKILAAIDIIKSGYLSELSRSDLAKHVGVHPDNLGKQFKRYTGKKLGDYIYELRVTEAAKRLRETDHTVIDIAFAVGFESLRTFNRVFPKFIGVTPDQYRRKHKEQNNPLSVKVEADL